MGMPSALTSNALGWLVLSGGGVLAYSAFRGDSPLSVVSNALNPSVKVRDLPGMAPVGAVGTDALPVDDTRMARPVAGYGLGNVRGHVAAAADELGPKFGITEIGGWRLDPTSDHMLGLALDYMTRDGAGLANFAKANAARLRVSYVIWDRRIWNVARAGDGWRAMADRGSVTANHEDHVHVSFKP